MPKLITTLLCCYLFVIGQAQDSNWQSETSYTTELATNTDSIEKQILKLSLVQSRESVDRAKMSWTPLLAWNNYDKLMLGAALSNVDFQSKKFEFTVAPLFSSKTKAIKGLADFKYNFFHQNKKFERLSFGVNLKQFNYNSNETFDYELNYYRVKPSITFVPLTKKAGTIDQAFSWSAYFIGEEKAEFGPDMSGGFGFLGKEVDNFLINELSYQLNRKDTISPIQLRVALEYQDYTAREVSENYLKATIELNTAYYYKANKKLGARIYFGYFISNTQRESSNFFDSFTKVSLATTGQGYADYKYEDLYFGRSELTGFLAHQVMLRGGGFKTATGQKFGTSNNIMTAINLDADLPMNLPRWLPLKAFFDVAFYDTKGALSDPRENKIDYSGGLMLSYFEGALGIYLPIINSSEIKDRLAEQGGFFSRVTFSLDLQRFNDGDLPQRLNYNF